MGLMMYTFGGLHPQLIWGLTLQEYLNLRDTAKQVNSNGKGSHGR